MLVTRPQKKPEPSNPNNNIEHKKKKNLEEN